MAKWRALCPLAMGAAGKAAGAISTVARSGRPGT